MPAVVVPHRECCCLLASRTCVLSPPALVVALHVLNAIAQVARCVHAEHALKHMRGPDLTRRRYPPANNWELVASTARDQTKVGYVQLRLNYS